jgi:hypothetical protein
LVVVVDVAVPLLEDPGVGVDHGFQPHDGAGMVLRCRGVAPLRSGCVSATATGATARPSAGLGSIVLVLIPLLSGCVSTTVAWVDTRPSGGLTGLVIFFFQSRDEPATGFGGLCAGHRGDALGGPCLCSGASGLLGCGRVYPCHDLSITLGSWGVAVRGCPPLHSGCGPPPVGHRLAIPGTRGGGRACGKWGDAIGGPCQQGGHSGYLASSCEVGGSRGVSANGRWGSFLCSRRRGGGGRSFDRFPWFPWVRHAMLGDSLAHDHQCHPHLLAGAVDRCLTRGTWFGRWSRDRNVGL